MKYLKIIVLTLTFFLLSCGGGSGSPSPTFNGLLAMSMHNGGLDNTDEKYIEDYDIAQSIGVNAAQVVIPWDVFEPSSGTYDTNFFTNAGWGFNALSALGLKMVIHRRH